MRACVFETAQWLNVCLTSAFDKCVALCECVRKLAVSGVVVLEQANQRVDLLDCLAKADDDGVTFCGGGAQQA
jgi:hypothetical protein